jgi:hypothetical protein
MKASRLSLEYENLPDRRGVLGMAQHGEAEQ